MGRKQTLRVLLVEDNPIDARAIMRNLMAMARVDTHVTHVSAFGEAISTLVDEQRVFDVVLLDLGLPDTSEFDALREITAQFSWMPVIVLSGFDEDALLDLTVDMGAQDYLQKGSYTPDLLRRAIIHAIKRKSTLELLHELEARQQVVSRFTEELVIVHERSGECIYTSGALEMFSSSPRSNLVGSAIQSLMRPRDREIFNEQMQDLSPIDVATMRFQLAEDESGTRWVESRTSWLDASGDLEPSLISVWRDVSEHQHLQEQLLQSQKMDAIGRLTGGVAHDFNNLLSIMTTCIDSLQGATPEGSDARETLNVLENTVNRGAALTRQLLTFSRQDKVGSTAVELDTIVSELVPILSRTLPEGYTLELDTKSEACLVQSDPAQLEQVVMNLIINAREAMPTGGKITVTVGTTLFNSKQRRHPKARRGRVYHFVQVSDDGVGMTSEIKSKIFEPFFSTKEKEGTGLGLATVYAITSRLRGFIEVDSLPGHGSSFTVYLPSHESQDAALDASVVESEAGARALEILLVEDDDVLRKLSKAILVERGYRVTTAGDGLEALDLLRAHGPFDLVITDVVMPKVDGAMLARYVEEESPSTPVLFTTGYTRDPHLLASFRSQKYYCLMKPFTPGRLYEAIDRSLASKDTHSEPH